MKTKNLLAACAALAVIAATTAAPVQAKSMMMHKHGMMMGHHMMHSRHHMMHHRMSMRPHMMSHSRMMMHRAMWSDGRSDFSGPAPSGASFFVRDWRMGREGDWNDSDTRLRLTIAHKVGAAMKRMARRGAVRKVGERQRASVWRLA